MVFTKAGMQSIHQPQEWFMIELAEMITTCSCPKLYQTVGYECNSRAFFSHDLHKGGAALLTVANIIFNRPFLCQPEL